MRTLAAFLVVSAAFAGEWSKTYTVGGSPGIDLRVDDGSLEFVQGGAGRVSVQVLTKGIDIRPGEVEVIESQSGDQVSIHVKYPRMRNWGFSSGNRSVRVSVTAPARLTLRAATGDGSIRASGIGGDLRLNTGDGSITASGLDGALEARTGDGSMNIAGRFDALRASTGDGSMDITAERGSKVSSGWNIDTGDGSVRVRVPSDIRADLDARTGDGTLRVDVPGVTTTGGDRNEMRARLNGGGMPLRIRTGDGSLTVAELR